MELRELRSLVALAELGSIAGTADKLHMSPAAIHKQLKVLEVEMGVQLYEKAGRRLRLTQVAEVLLPHIRNLLAQYDATIAALNDWKGMKCGLVRIGTGPTFSSYVLPSLLKEFRSRFPEVEIYVETGNTHQLVEALGSGLLDVTILVASKLSEAPGFKVEAVWDFEVVLVSSRQRLGKPCRLVNLRDLPFILYKKGTIFERITDHYFAEAGFSPRVTMRFDNAEAIKAMVRAGLGISMLPLWTVEAELKSKALSLIRQQEAPLLAKIALVTRKLSYLPHPVSAFINTTKKWKSAQLTSR